MLFEISLFPKHYRPFLDNAILEASPLKYTIVSEKDYSEDFVSIVIEANGLTELLMLGIGIGHAEMEKGMLDAMPAVYRNVDNLIKIATTQSDN